MRTCVLIVVAAALAPAADGPPAPADRVTATGASKFFLAYSPDGRTLAYAQHHANRRQSGLVLMGVRLVDADGANDRPLLSAWDREVQVQEHPAWSPDGRKMLISGGGYDTANASKDVYVVDLDGGLTAKALRKLVHGEGTTMGEQPAWSPDGRQVVASGVTAALWVVNSNGVGRKKLTQQPGSYLMQPHWSPDGSRIAFASDRDGNSEVYTIRPDGTDLVRLTNHPGIDCRPRWSPDGRWVAFTSNRGGDNDVYAVRPDGTDLHNLTRHPSNDDHAAWSPDGKSLAFVSMRDGAFDIYRLAVPDALGVGGRPGQVVANDPPPPPPPPAAPAAAKGGPVLYYDFDQGVGPVPRDRCRDRAGDAHGATVNTAWVKMRRGSALRFDGEKSFVDAGNPAALQSDGALTATVWVKPAAGTQFNHYLVTKYGWNIYLDAALVPHFETRNFANTAWETLDGPARLEVDRWHCVAVVFDPSARKKRLYVNGQMVAEADRADDRLGDVRTYGFELGRYSLTMTQTFRGSMDELRVYNRVLSSDELKSAYEAEAAAVEEPEAAGADAPQPRPAGGVDVPVASGPTPGLVLYYDFDQGVGPVGRGRCRDRAGDAHGTLLGASWVKMRRGSALKFDGERSVVDGGNPTVLQIDGGLTVTVWVKPLGGTRTNHYVLTKYAWNLYLDAGLTPHFETRNAANSAWETLDGPARLEPNRWYALAVTYDPASRKKRLYVNGEPAAEAERADERLGPATLYGLELGRYTQSGSQHLHGVLDELRVYDRPLPPEEIKAAVARERDAVEE